MFNLEPIWAVNDVVSALLCKLGACYLASTCEPPVPIGVPMFLDHLLANISVLPMQLAICCLLDHGDSRRFDVMVEAIDRWSSSFTGSIAIRSYWWRQQARSTLPHCQLPPLSIWRNGEIYNTLISPLIFPSITKPFRIQDKTTIYQIPKKLLPPFHHVRPRKHCRRSQGQPQQPK